jgi:hypothetical protein
MEKFGRYAAFFLLLGEREGISGFLEGIIMVLSTCTVFLV